MSIALWCVLAAAFLPYPFTLAAKWSRRFNNHQPREYLETTQGWQKRAHWTQLNSFEAFPPFAAAVIINHMLLGANAHADVLALLFIALRLGYGLFYVADWALPRSIAWFAASLCSAALFLLAARII
jgi:uncharacterized MAPEG superfamily protein